MSPTAKNLTYAWATAIAVPFALALALQVPLCAVENVSQFFEQLKPLYTFILLSILFVLPGYGGFIYFMKGKKRLLNIGIFTLILPGFLIALWIFGFYTSRLFFSDCI